LVWFILRPCQHDNGYIDGRSQIKVHTDERTQVHSAQPSLVEDRAAPRQVWFNAYKKIKQAPLFIIFATNLSTMEGWKAWLAWVIAS